jgi:esterase/lipase superfamily enzyme
VFRRFLPLAVLLIAAAGVAAGQSPPDSGLPEPCPAAGVAESLPALEKRKQRLERQLRRSFRAKTVRKRQEELLGVIFRIACLEAAGRVEVVEILPVRESVSRPPTGHPVPVPQSLSSRPADERADRRLGKPRHVVEVATYYATNRTPSGRTEPAKVYDARVAPMLTYGRAVVTIPTAHRPGEIELPKIWRLEFQPDPTRHFILKSVSPLGLDAARAEMAQRLEGSGTKAILVFVHGYNTGFQEAAMRTAQLAYDLRFQGVPLFFSWPSAAKLVSYLKDAETAELSEGAFDRLLDDLAELPATDIYVIAHSMGSRIVSKVLKSRVERGRPTRNLSELLLAAPDINARLFRTVIAPKLAALQGTRITVYASSSDLALKASRAVHGFRRVGDTAGEVFVYEGMETIDASKVSLVRRSFGHSYLMDSAPVLKDLQSIMSQKLPAKLRGLIEAGKLPHRYWRFQ